jgi:hypothetical protein
MFEARTKNHSRSTASKPGVRCSTPGERTRGTESGASANRIGQADALAATRGFVAHSPGARLSWLPKSCVENHRGRARSPRGRALISQLRLDVELGQR